MRILLGCAVAALAAAAAASPPELNKLTTGQMMTRCQSDRVWCMNVLQRATKCAPRWMTAADASRQVWRWIHDNRKARYPAASALTDAQAKAFPGGCADIGK